MSYSLSVKTADKASAKQAVEAKVNEIVTQQPVHAKDRAAILANANAAIDLLEDDAACDVSVSLNGWVGTAVADSVRSVSITASAGLVARA